MRRVPRARTSWLIAVAVAALMTACETQPDVQVVDGTTGKPLEGVYVIATWDIWRPMPVQSHTSCGKVEVVRTDANGHFVVSEHARGILVRLFGSELRHLRFYAPGLRVDEMRSPPDSVRVYMRADDRNALERLRYLNELAGKTDCGSRPEDQVGALTLYKQFFKEGKGVAHTHDERAQLSSLEFDIERFELGYEEALARSEKRLANGYRDFD